MAFVPFVETDQPTMEAFNEKFQALRDEVVKFEKGSYVGTGTSGSQNPTVINFQSEPFAVFITDESDSTISLAFVGQSGFADSTGGVVYQKNKTQLSFYSIARMNAASHQLNASETTYHYVGLCLKEE